MLNIEYLRTFKIGEYAIFDLSISFLGVYLLSPLLTRFFKIFKLSIPLSSWMYLTLPLSILAHIATGKYTPMTKYFLDPSGHYFLKIFIIILLLLGLKLIKIIR
ncbi:MAG: hypothetical protein WAV40_03435, partial [Microgenomates group bacterium]